MTDQPTATHEIADATTDELVLATDLYDRCREVDPALAIAEITASLAAARRAGFAAGLEERADDAHLAGYTEGRAAALAVFEALFAGGPDTSIRTVWDETQAVPALGIGPLECASVPMSDLRAAFDEARQA